MRTSFYSIDIIHIRVYILGVIIIIEHCYLNGHIILLRLEINSLPYNRCTMTIDVTDKLFQPILGMEYFRNTQIPLLIRTQIGKRYSDTGIKERQFTHTACYNIVFIFSQYEYGIIRPKLLACAT